MASIEEIRYIHGQNDMTSEDIHIDNDKYMTNAYNLSNYNLIKWLYNNAILLESKYDDNILIEMMIKTINKDKLNRLGEIFNNIGQLNEKLFIEGCKKGNLDIVKYVKTHKMYKLFKIDNNLYLGHAVKSNNIELVKYIIKEFIEIKNQTNVNTNNIYNISVNMACEQNNFKMLKLLDETTNIKYNDYMIKYVCENGNIDMFEFIMKKYIPKNKSILFIAACKSGNIQMATKVFNLHIDLNEEFRIFDRKPSNLISSCSGYKITKFPQICSCFDEAVICAYDNNLFDIFLWLNTIKEIDLDRYYISTVKFLYKICQNGHDECFNYLYSYCLIKKKKLTGKIIKTFGFKLEHNREENIVFLEVIKSGNLNLIKKIFLLDCIDDIYLNSTITDLREYMCSPVSFFSSEPMIVHIYVEACLRNYTNVIEWLIKNINSYKILNDIKYYMLALNNNNIDMALLFYDNNSNNKLIIRQNNDELFKLVCEKNNIIFGKWLTSICDIYHIEIIDDKIFSWTINNNNNNNNYYFNDDIKQYLDNGNYYRLCDMFGTKISNKIYIKKYFKKCVVCNKRKSRHLITKCDHVYCFKCIFNKYCINGDNINCILCQTNIKLNECIYKHSLFGWLIYNDK